MSATCADSLFVNQSVVWCVPRSAHASQQGRNDTGVACRVCPAGFASSRLSTELSLFTGFPPKERLHDYRKFLLLGIFCLLGAKLAGGLTGNVYPPFQRDVVRQGADCERNTV